MPPIQHRLQLDGVQTVPLMLLGQDLAEPLILPVTAQPVLPVTQQPALPVKQLHQLFSLISLVTCGNVKPNRSK